MNFCPVLYTLGYYVVAGRCAIASDGRYCHRVTHCLPLPTSRVQVLPVMRKLVSRFGKTVHLATLERDALI